MQRIVLFGGFMFAVVFITAATSHSDSASPPSLPSVAADEPITGTAAVSAPGSETPPRDPFTPYDIGPPGSAWPYEQASPAEKAELDRLRDRTGWQKIHNGFAAGVNLRVRDAEIAAAQHQLKVDNLATEGVVP